MTAICIIPAKGTSKRIPGKNIREFLGTPMLSRAVKTARESEIFDDIVVCSDNATASLLAWNERAAFLERPAELCADQVGTQEVMRWGLGALANDEHPQHYDYACCLYPCSPLLVPKDLSIAMGGLLAHPRLDYAMSVGTDPLCDAGNFYLGKSSAFRAGASLIGVCTMMVPIPPERCCDINTPEDWARAEQLYKALHKEKEVA